MKTYKWYLVTAIIALVIGFFAGRSISDVKTEVQLVKGKTIHQSVPKIELVPYAVTTPVLMSYKDHAKKDSTGQHVITATPTNKDSAVVATVADWNMKRYYAKTLFDNEYGKEDYRAVIQYNQLQELSYNFTPITREKTIEKKQTLTPFVSGSFSSFNVVGVGGGVFYHNLGFELQYLNDLQNSRSGYMAGVKYKF